MSTIERKSINNERQHSQQSEIFSPLLKDEEEKQNDQTLEKAKTDGVDASPTKEQQQLKKNEGDKTCNAC